MSIRGCDANQDLSNHATCLAKAGFTFACRYYKSSPSCLSKAEAMALSAAGLYVVTIVENGSPTSAAYFSHAKGLEDGMFAIKNALFVGQSAGSPIYFAVDHDASQAEVLGVITDYFTGVVAAFAKTGNAHPIGVYGSGLVCSHIKKSIPGSYAWLSMSTGWAGSHTFADWNLKQTVGSTVCGISVDEDISQGHGGGWKI